MVLDDLGGRWLVVDFTSRLRVLVVVGGSGVGCELCISLLDLEFRWRLVILEWVVGIFR